MTLEQLRVFVAVADREHVTQAAAALNLAQSAVSATVASLEAEHRVRLFARIGRNIRLTDDGKVFLREARAVLEQAERARRTMRDCAAATTLQPGCRS